MKSKKGRKCYIYCSITDISWKIPLSKSRLVISFCQNGFKYSFLYSCQHRSKIRFEIHVITGISFAHFYHFRDSRFQGQFFWFVQVFKPTEITTTPKRGGQGARGSPKHDRFILDRMSYCGTRWSIRQIFKVFIHKGGCTATAPRTG